MAHTKQSNRDSLLFSVIICTYQRAELLRIAIQSLCEQQFDAANYEIIVVDNNSRDRTRAVSSEFVNSYNNVRYCLEKKQGLSHARNRGWQEAKGEYVAYIDDECRVPSQWLTVAKRIIDEFAPGVFGGPFFGYHSQDAPHWWKDLYGEFTYATSAGALSEDEHVSGGNFIARRTLLMELGGFDVARGMSGNTIAFGEESEFQQRVRNQKPDELIYYDPALYLYHLIRPEKYSLWWLLKSRFHGGRDSYFVFRSAEVPRDSHAKIKLVARALRISAKCLVGLATNSIFRDKGQHPYFQNYLYEETGDHVHQLGAILERYREVSTYE